MYIKIFLILFNFSSLSGFTINKRDVATKKSNIKNPNPIDNTTSINGSKIIDAILALPATKVLATPNEIENSTNPTASSNATTGRSVSVTGPFALYCLTTINVAAGAVAEAIAPKIIAEGKGNFSGIIKCRPINAASTNKVVNTA